MDSRNSSLDSSLRSPRDFPCAKAHAAERTDGLRAEHASTGEGSSREA